MTVHAPFHPTTMGEGGRRGKRISYGDRLVF